MYEHLILKPFSIGYKVWLHTWQWIGVNITEETHVMLQEDINDAFRYHQHRNDMLDNREMSV